MKITAIISFLLCMSALTGNAANISIIHEMDANGNVTNAIVDGKILTPEELYRHLSDFGEIGTVITTNDKGILVISVIEGTPAQSAGIVAGDTILSVNGTPLRNLSLSESAKVLRGYPGTIAQLTIHSLGETDHRSVSVTRDIIRLKEKNPKEVEQGGAEYPSHSAGSSDP